MTGILEHGNPSIKEERQQTLLYEGLKGKASIPTDDFVPLAATFVTGNYNFI